jgi:hypothetical protein
MHIDRGHKIEPQQRKVRQVILRQRLISEVSMYATQATKTIHGHARAFEVGHLDAMVVADHHVLDVTASINESADLPARFM